MVSESGMKDHDDREDPPYWISGRSLPAIVESGTYYNKDRDAIKEDDRRKIFRDICVSIIISGKNGETCISTLATIQKRFSQKYSLEDLQNIKGEAYEVIRILKMQAESELIDAAQESDDIKRIANLIIEKGKIRDIFKRQYARIHASDDKIADVILHGFVLQGIQNPDVIIHPCLDGERGSGKSSGVDAALHLLPQEYTDSSKQSVKALFYHTVLEKSVIYLDDNVWNEELGSFFKSYMNDVSRGISYKTLDTDRKPITLTFPLGCMLIASSVTDSSDDQMLDRQYRIAIERDDDKAKKHDALIIRELATGQTRRLFTDKGIKVIREVLRVFRNYKFIVILPDAERLKFADDASSRNKEMFKVFLRAVVILNYKQRRHEVNGENVITVWSEGEDFRKDFNQAVEIFDINKDKRRFDLNDREHKVLLRIMELTGDTGQTTVKDVVSSMKRAGMTDTTIRYAIKGRNGIGGLLSKIPQMTVTKGSRHNKDSGKTTPYESIELPAGFTLDDVTYSFVKLE